MGKGDKRSKRGKIIQGSFGVSRPHKPNKGAQDTSVSTAKKSTGKTKAKSKKS